MRRAACTGGDETYWGGLERSNDKRGDGGLACKCAWVGKGGQRLWLHAQTDELPSRYISGASRDVERDARRVGHVTVSFLVLVTSAC